MPANNKSDEILPRQPGSVKREQEEEGKTTTTVNTSQPATRNDTYNVVSPDEQSRLDGLAFELFKERSPKLHGRSAQELVLTCYHDAGVFIQTADKLRKGEVEVSKPKSRFNEACAPNLHKLHPINLVAQGFVEKNGGEAVVTEHINRIAKVLTDHPLLGMDDKYNVQRKDLIISNGKLEEVEGLQLNWDMPAVGTARHIIPHYATQSVGS